MTDGQTSRLNGGGNQYTYKAPKSEIQGRKDISLGTVGQLDIVDSKSRFERGDGRE